jgi:3-oxoacyl-[acyl-carrier-protein] synthase II
VTHSVPQSHSSRRARRAQSPDRREVVITGLGAVTPSGLDAQSTWQSVREGRSAISRLEGAEFADLRVRIGGQVRGFIDAGLLPERESRRLADVLLWAIAAGDEAMAQGDPPMPSGAEYGFSIIAATGSGPVRAMQDATRALDDLGPRAVPAALAMHGAPDAAAALLSQRYGALGAAGAVSATCASGAVALGEGLRRIRHGYADTVLVVGYEDCLGAVNLSSNANLRALASGFDDDPTAASRPFDAARSGFVMSQGASAILLEAKDAVLARGGTPIAELAGFGAASDAHHPTAPHPEGRGAIAAMQACLADARMRPDEVGHIIAHGTSTKLNDETEALALERVFGGRLGDVPVSATKSSTGHLLGASGVLEAMLAALTLRDGVLPPTLNLTDPAFPDLDVVTEARSARVSSVLSNSFGFGGHNGAVLLRTV